MSERSPLTVIGVCTSFPLSRGPEVGLGLMLVANATATVASSTIKTRQAANTAWTRRVRVALWRTLKPFRPHRGR